MDWVDLVNQANWMWVKQGGLSSSLSYFVAIGFFWLLGLALYLFPSFVALLTRKRNALAILVLNFFLGWTVVGWVGALVWAFVADSPARVERSA